MATEKQKVAARRNVAKARQARSARAHGKDRDKAWMRILSAAERFDIEVPETDWRDLAKGGKDRKR